MPGFFNAISANGYTLGPIIGRITADAVRGEAVEHTIGWIGSDSRPPSRTMCNYCLRASVSICGLKFLACLLAAVQPDCYERPAIWSAR